MLPPLIRTFLFFSFMALALHTVFYIDLGLTNTKIGMCKDKHKTLDIFVNCGIIEI